MAEDIKPLKADKLYEYADAIAKGECGEFIYCFEGGNYYQYDNGYWQVICAEQFLSVIQDKLIREKKVRTKHGEEIVYITTKGKILTSLKHPDKKNILENFKLIKNINLDQMNKYPFINLENYMFDPIGINVFKHDSKYYSTIRVPYEYKEKADCPLWIKTLNEIFENDSQKISSLQEFFGYCLLPGNKQKKALLIVGESNTGKSTLLNVLRLVMGENNCSSVPLKCFHKDNQLPTMIGKLINIDADVGRDAAEYEPSFKIITGGDPIHCDPKYTTPFSFMPTCKVVLAANIFPKITDHSSAFYNRLILIPLERIFKEEEQNKDLIDELSKELPGILNWTIEGLRQINKRGRFEIHEYIKEAVKILEDENNPVNLFFEEHIEIEMNSFVEKGDLYEKYCGWCVRNNNGKLSKAHFSTCIHKKYYKQTTASAQHPQTRKRIWWNIKYVEFKTVEPMKWDETTPATASNKNWTE